MSDNDIFKNDPNSAPDPDKDYFTELVGEDKRFKSPQELAKGKVEADNFIERLQAEAAELREELNKRVTYEELMNNINNRSAGETPHSQDAGGHQETPPADQLKPDDIQKLVEQGISERQESERRAKNAAETKERLQQLYGRDYVSRLEARVAELDTTKEFMQELAQTNPKMFFEILGQPRQESNVTPPRSSMNTSTLPPSSGTKNYAYFQNLRRKDPKSYFTPQVQQELFREAQRQGDSFYN